MQANEDQRKSCKFIRVRVSNELIDIVMQIEEGQRVPCMSMRIGEYHEDLWASENVMQIDKDMRNLRFLYINL